jgi:hypothetical protein
MKFGGQIIIQVFTIAISTSAPISINRAKLGKGKHGLFQALTWASFTLLDVAIF